MNRLSKALTAIMLMMMVLFVTGCNPEDNPSSGNHEYVDLGLPSGTLWATCNIGATTPEGYGDHFSWGETETKTIYNWTTYKYSDGDSDQLNKYCYTDNLTTLQPVDDAAAANWGSGWYVPTKDQWEELYNNTTNIWMVQNGVNGRLFSASNGNKLFLPAAGGYWDDKLLDLGEYGDYWSSSLSGNNPHYAWIFLFDSYGCNVHRAGCGRCDGYSVRAVRSARQN